jgi:hypothetical protein
VICFQEFPFDEDSSFLEAFVKNGYDFKFAPSSYLTKIFAGGTKLYGELTLYKKSELELLDFQIVISSALIFWKKDSGSRTKKPRF